MNKINTLKNKIKNPGSLLASGGLTFTFRIAGLVLSFFVVLVITHLYGDSAYGNYSLAFTLSQALGLVFAIGFPNALISYIGSKPITHPLSQQMLKKAFRILFFISLLPLTLLYFGADIIAESIFNNSALSVYITIAAFTIPAMILHELLLYFFIATGNFIKFGLFMFIVPNMLLLILLVCIGNVAEQYTFLFYFISVVATLLTESFYAFKPAIKEKLPNEIPVRKMIAFTLPMMFSGLMLYMLNWTDVFMLGALVKEDELGHYNVAYKIASLATLIIISMNVVIAPRIAALYTEQNFAQMHKTVRKTTWLIILLTLPIVMVLTLFADFFMGLFGENFTGGSEALIIIATGFLLNAATGNVDQILNMTNNQKILLYVTIFGFVCNVVLNMLFIPKYGINGAAMASLITNVVFNFTCVIIIKKRLGFYTFA